MSLLLRIFTGKRAQIVLYGEKAHRLCHTKKREFMKKNMGVFWGVPRAGVGVALLALFAFTSVSRADIDIVNSLGDSIAGEAAVSTRPYKAQDFSTIVSGQISGVVLDLNFNAAAVTAGSTLDVYIYNATGSGPTGIGFMLGTITATTSGANQYSVGHLQAFSLTAGQDYAIAVDIALPGSPTVAWEYAALNSPNTGTGGSFLNAYNSTNGISNWANASQQRLMAVTVVPEPTTGAILGIGAVAIAASRTLRRRITAGSKTNT